MASVSDNPSRFFIGSAGLTHAFASLLPVGNRKRTIFQPSEGGNLIIVGSLAYASRSAAEDLLPHVISDIFLYHRIYCCKALQCWNSLPAV